VSKYDGEIRAVADVSGELEDLLASLGQPPRIGRDRHDAMAHYLSGEEGWHDARKKLRGTFAKPTQNGTGLSDGSDK
jgi:plasmid stabilization system protein ParE